MPEKSGPVTETPFSATMSTNMDMRGGGRSGNDCLCKPRRAAHVCWNHASLGHGPENKFALNNLNNNQGLPLVGVSFSPQAERFMT